MSLFINGVEQAGTYTDADAIAAVEGEATLALAGVVTKVAQPAFAAINSVGDVDVTGNATLAAVDFDTELFDQNGDFASDTFTAPVTGRYLLTVHIQMSDATAALTSVGVNLVTSNRTWFHTLLNGTTDDTGIRGVMTTAVVDMDADDTVSVQLQCNGEGTDIIDIDGAAFPVTDFTGILVA